MNKSIKDKTIILTGATGEIGRATAHALAKEGAVLILISRSPDKLGQLAEELKGGYGIKTLICPMDIRDEMSCERAVGAVIEQYRKVDILINNAGIGLFKSIEDTSKEEIERVIQTNLLGPLYLCRAAIPFMKQQGFGHILNISSVAGRRAFPQLTAYCASKYGLIGLSDSLRAEMLKAGIPIRVTVINPPAVDTGFFDQAGYTTYREDHPLVTLIPPEIIAKAVVKAIQKPGTWEITLTFRARILNFLNKLSPRLIEYLNRKAGQAVRKKKSS